MCMLLNDLCVRSFDERMMSRAARCADRWALRLSAFISPHSPSPTPSPSSSCRRSLSSRCWRWPLLPPPSLLRMHAMESPTVPPVSQRQQHTQRRQQQRQAGGDGRPRSPQPALQPTTNHVHTQTHMPHPQHSAPCTYTQCASSRCRHVADPVHCSLRRVRDCVSWLLRHRAVTTPSYPRFSTIVGCTQGTSTSTYVHNSDTPVIVRGSVGPRSRRCVSTPHARAHPAFGFLFLFFVLCLFSPASVVHRCMPSRGLRSSARPTRTGEWASTAAGGRRVAGRWQRHFGLSAAFPHRPFCFFFLFVFPLFH